MSFLGVDTAELAAAGGQVAAIAASFQAANGAAAAPTTAVLPANADDTSALVAAAFSTHGGLYQAMAAEAAAMKELYATMMGASSGSYAVTEAANAVVVL